ncbi:MAG: ATP-binding protein [Polyangiales bacterium]
MSVSESPARAEARIAQLERTLEDKKRELFVVSEKLRTANDYVLQLYQVMPDALLMVSEQGTIVDVNQAGLELLGYTDAELRGQPVSVLCERAARSLRDAAAGPVPRHEEAWATKAGEKLPVLVSTARLNAEDGQLLSVLLVGVDLRNYKRLELELRHAQKLEAIGQLAAGVAHEINTPMQFIGDNVAFLQDGFNDLMGLVQLYERLRNAGETPAGLEELAALRERADLDYLESRGPRAFETTLQGVTRVSAIVAALKTFAHPQHDKSMVDLNKAVEDTLTVAKGEYKYVAEVSTELGDIPLVLCHGSDINQVLLNLVVNAAHAVSDGQTEGEPARGRIVVKTVQDGSDVVLSVSDSGCGIPEDIRHRIFDPFFTTKEVGRGTGQGLTISYNLIVEKHGGSLSFESEVGRGTTFFVRLPIEGARESRELAS